ncbi:PAS domain S-box protein [Mucilaginibacter terrenus]|uniref:histidine kinase n=1 Tax=Mucilaginibacter terrenus TaxID=2482727 RepID=A0A3E2NR70_9SPHI|nr:PAS domain-containing sensor histidine kinase [Mucilaginibacter terrenus]RFZ83487.1 PAS domain S-box protein [Mucilaginibacter terrenus]
MDTIVAPQDKEALFDVVFYNNPVPMWYYDRATLRFLEVNQVAIDRYGYSREEFLSMTIQDIRPEEDIPTLMKTVKGLIAPLENEEVFRHVYKDGTVRSVKIIAYPARFNNHDARIVIVNDVTDITLLMERFELIAKATQDAVWDWNLQTNELWWNQTFLDLFGHKKDEVELNIDSWVSRIHPEDRERVMNGIHQAIDNGEEKWCDEYRFLRGDGTYASTLDRGYVIYKNDKAVRMLGSMMDVTEQKLLQKAQEDSETLLQTITSASPAALWMADEAGNVVYVNQKWIEWSNAGVGENLGEGWLQVVHPDDRTRVWNTYQNAHVSRDSYEVDYRILFNDGSVRWVTATGLPRLTADNRFIGFVGSVTDITRQKQLELQKDGFISTVSHELKTPIASIKGYEQLLSRTKSVKDTQGLNFLNRMRVQINRLDTLVQDLLDISRIESGKLIFKESIFEVNVLMAELVPDLQLVYPTHTLMLVENQSCKISADRNRIVQLITNLVDNAVKYSPGASKVLIRLTCDEEYLSVCIQDFGKGISKEQESFIFERFYQVNNVYKAPGLGIGLYVCKEIIDRLNGNIWFESVVEQGTTFHFKLPRKLEA